LVFTGDEKQKSPLVLAFLAVGLPPVRVFNDVAQHALAFASGEKFF
jgi:hypothetical protein